MVVRLARGSMKYILIFFLPFPLIFFYPFGTMFAVLSTGFGIYTVWFFRDPHRKIQVDDNVVYAAADGTVIYTEISENAYKVAIRMSPFDVHINRAPVSGTVTSTVRSPGAHRSVYFSGAEKKNERNLIKMESKGMEVEILQLTGAFARRIEVWIDEGQEVVQGEQIGMIRFGSQTNVLVKTIKPLRLTVSQGDKVKAGLTQIMEVVHDD